MQFEWIIKYPYINFESFCVSRFFLGFLSFVLLHTLASRTHGTKSSYHLLVGLGLVITCLCHPP